MLFKVISIKRQLKSDMTDFNFLGIKYRMTARPIILWKYTCYGWILDSDLKLKGFQTPWITLVWKN